MAPRDPYAVLGVPKTASDDELKKAYRKLARELHPDRNPDDPSAEERFKDVQTAYDILSDTEKRQAYDRFGANGPGPQGGFGPGGARYQNVDLGDLSDLLGNFGSFFGRGQRSARPQPERGADFESRVRISFEDALEGVQIRVPIEVETACHVCGGSGAEPGTAPRTCPDCQGSGVIADSQGLFALSHPCPRCRGNGVVVDTPCKSCRGSGRERVTRRYQVKVPAGAKDGTRIRLKGKGEPGRAGGPAGDLFVRVEVEPSPLYERRGSDLVLEVPVTYPEAALGATVQIPTPQGPVGLKVPSGSESGKLLRVKGRGAPEAEGRRQGRPARAPQGHGAEQALEGRARGARGLPALLPRGAARAPREERVMPDRPRYMISVAAELAGLHPQTMRMYESRGLVRPARTPGGTRLYSENDVERLKLIQRLTTELGLNLAGVEHVLRLEDELRRLTARMRQLERELRDEIRSTHQQYRREIVVYREPQPPARQTRGERWTSRS